MKLIFEKDPEKNMTVKIKDGVDVKDFSYIEMIKLLRDENKFEPSDFCNDITPDERERVNDMLKEINSVITGKEK